MADLPEQIMVVRNKETGHLWIMQEPRCPTAGVEYGTYALQEVIFPSVADSEQKD